MDLPLTLRHGSSSAQAPRSTTSPRPSGRDDDAHKDDDDDVIAGGAPGIVAVVVFIVGDERA
jgi:hypothetical protein